VTPIDPKELLAAYAMGDVTDDERRAVDAYLLESSAARAELEEIRATVAAVTDAEPTPAREPNWERLTADIMAPLRATPKTVPLWQRTPARWAALATLAAAAIAIVWLGRQQPGSTPSPVPTVAHTSSDESTMPDHSWLEPTPPQLAQASDDELTEDWLEESGSEDDESVDLDALDLDELRAVDRALASL